MEGKGGGFVRKSHMTVQLQNYSGVGLEWKVGEWQVVAGNGN